MNNVFFFNHVYLNTKNMLYCYTGCCASFINYLSISRVAGPSLLVYLLTCQLVYFSTFLRVYLSTCLFEECS